MSTFNSYEKVERIEKEECRGLLEGKSHIFEKIDGANSQIFLLDFEVAYGSRNRVLGVGDNLLSGDSFRGFYPWIKENIEFLNQFFFKYRDVTLYGEWLVKHTIPYPAEYLSKFYCFDIMDGSGKFFYPSDPIWIDLQTLFNYPIIIPCDGIVENCNIEDLKEFLEKPSSFGAPYREGVVIKNYDFINKYGRTPYGKLLHKDFTEVKGKTKKNISPEDLEVSIADVYCTKARVVKICNKIKMNRALEGVDSRIIVAYSADTDASRLEMKDVPRVMNMVFYDILTEEMNDILKKFKYPTIDFKKFKFVVFDIAKKHFVEYLDKQT